jgi:hypothetical protein
MVHRPSNYFIIFSPHRKSVFLQPKNLLQCSLKQDVWSYRELVQSGRVFRTDILHAYPTFPYLHNIF